jgi:hypothetical protein
MKKLLSIAIAFIILLSGMNLSIATHYCGGEVAAVKWSFSGQKASCGMENPKPICPANKGIASNCCHNKISFLKVDKNYCPSTFKIKDVTKSLLQVFNIPVNISCQSLFALNSIQKNFSPPGNLSVSTVCLADICVFRI